MISAKEAFELSLKNNEKINEKLKEKIISWINYTLHEIKNSIDKAINVGVFETEISIKLFINGFGKEIYDFVKNKLEPEFISIVIKELENLGYSVRENESYCVENYVCSWSDNTVHNQKLLTFDNIDISIDFK